jgi:hypothetical protein
VAPGKHVDINIAMNYLVIYPGRFHLFHLGHKGVYDYLVKKYTPEGGYVKIATTEKQDPISSPFSYSDKVAMLTKMGVPASNIIKVVNPYSIDEYGVSDPRNTVLIFAVGAKDQQVIKDAAGKIVQRPRFSFKPRKDGSPSATQPLPGNLKKCRPISDGVVYVDVVDTIPFKVLGKDADSASQVRKLYLDGNDNDRNQIITDLYGAPDPELKAVFDQKLGVNKLDKTVTYGKEIIDGGEAKVGIMRESRSAKLQKLSERIQQLKQAIKESRKTPINPDYLDEKKSR